MVIVIAQVVTHIARVVIKAVGRGTVAISRFALAFGLKTEKDFRRIFSLIPELLFRLIRLISYF